MASSAVTCLFGRTLSVTYESIRMFTCSTTLNKGEVWRQQKGLHWNWKEDDAFILGADWSYADGRPGVLSNKQQEIVKRNVEYSKQAVQMLKEVDNAVVSEQDLIKKNFDERKKLLRQRPKEKGNAFDETI